MMKARTTMNNTAMLIENGKCSLGLELGSTRIKSVLITPDGAVAASGAFDWHDTLKDGVWTYSLKDAEAGVQSCYAALKANVETEHGVKLRRLASIGVSAMMHGYLAFDKDGKLLVPFRTWRNTITGEAAEKLTNLLGFNIPQRWSIAHLYQAILNGEEHTGKIDFMTTLAGYVHYRLTGEKVLGVGDASGMFPIDSSTADYDCEMMKKFDAILKEKDFGYTLSDILPPPINAGTAAGSFSEAGALFLDPTGETEAGCTAAPPEGDAGTGMVATDSVSAGGGNISAGTSIFSMTVLEKPLEGVYPEIDIVTTPDAQSVAMVHCNTCTSDFDAWVSLFGEFARLSGSKLKKSEIYDLLYAAALEGEPDCGGSVSYNCYSGEPVVGIEEGRPLFVRRPDVPLTLKNFVRAELYSLMAPLRVGTDILMKKEKVRISSMLCHGGLFKTPLAAQSLMAGALKIPLSVMANAGEGGPWGMALLASYTVNKNEGESLQSFLDRTAFARVERTTVEPDDKVSAGFDKFLENYIKCLPLENAAAELL